MPVGNSVETENNDEESDDELGGITEDFEMHDVGRTVTPCPWPVTAAGRAKKYNYKLQVSNNLKVQYSTV